MILKGLQHGAVAYGLKEHLLPSRSQKAKTAIAEDLNHCELGVLCCHCAEGTRLQHDCAYPRMKHGCASPPRKKRLCLPRGNNGCAGSSPDTNSPPYAYRSRLFHNRLIVHILVNEATFMLYEGLASLYAIHVVDFLVVPRATDLERKVNIRYSGGKFMSHTGLIQWVIRVFNDRSVRKAPSKHTAQVYDA